MRIHFVTLLAIIGLFTLPIMVHSNTVIKVSDKGNPTGYSLNWAGQRFWNSPNPPPVISGDGMNLLFSEYSHGSYVYTQIYLALSDNVRSPSPLEAYQFGPFDLKINSAGNYLLEDTGFSIDVYLRNNSSITRVQQYEIQGQNSDLISTITKTPFGFLDNGGNIFYSRQYPSVCDPVSFDPDWCNACIANPFDANGCFELWMVPYVYKNNLKLGPGAVYGVSNDGSKVVSAETYGHTFGLVSEEITVRNGDGSCIVSLGQGLEPYISANGMKVVYDCPGGGTCLINSDGTGFKKISTLTGYKTSNSDASLILISASDGHDNELYLYNASDDSVTAITNNEWNETWPDMADSGHVFTFVSDKEGLQNVYVWYDTGLTPVGYGVVVDLAWGVTSLFRHVTSPGRTSMDVDDLSPGTLPAGFNAASVPAYFHLSTTATFSGPVQTCITYQESDFGAGEPNLHLLQYAAGAWTDVTSSFDPAANQICGMSTVLGDLTVVIGDEPWNPDCDDDGLVNADEEFVYLTDPLNPDTDGDGLPDGLEALGTSTDVLIADTDGDILLDGAEDADADGITEATETDPTNPDTDGDGLNDGMEITLGTSPLILDTDGDGVSDGDEVAAETNPLKQPAEPKSSAGSQAIKFTCAMMPADGPVASLNWLVAVCLPLGLVLAVKARRNRKSNR